jgi:hypothetical protein
MSQQEKNQKKIQELEAAKSKLSTLIEKLKANPSLSDEEISKIEGGASSGLPGESTSDQNCGIC